MPLKFFFSFGDETLKTRTLKKQLQIQRKEESDCVCLGKAKARNHREDTKFTLQADPGHRDNVQLSKQTKQEQ